MVKKKSLIEIKVAKIIVLVYVVYLIIRPPMPRPIGAVIEISGLISFILLVISWFKRRSKK